MRGRCRSRSALGRLRFRGIARLETNNLAVAARADTLGTLGNFHQDGRMTVAVAKKKLIIVLAYQGTWLAVTDIQTVEGRVGSDASDEAKKSRASSSLHFESRF